VAVAVWGSETELSPALAQLSVQEQELALAQLSVQEQELALAQEWEPVSVLE
jgi:hypothetical protein